jgi:hypothetical protein
MKEQTRKRSFFLFKRHAKSARVTGRFSYSILLIWSARTSASQEIPFSL